MQLPALPTDNLYKFMAISGLIVIILSFVLPFQADHRVQEQIRETELERRLLEVEIDVMMASVIQADSALLELFRMGEYQPHLSERFYWLERSQWDSVVAGRTRDLIDEQIAGEGGLVPWTIAGLQRSVRLQHQVHVAQDLLLVAERISWIGRAGKVVGAILLCAGFGLWFARVQIWQDRILRRESAAPTSMRA